MADPVVDIATYLGAQTSLNLGTDLFYGIKRAQSDAVPVRAVFVIGQPGPPAARTLGTLMEIRREAVQLLIRDSDYMAGYDLAQMVYRVLQSATLSGYMDLQARQSEPVFVGEDKDVHYFWSINFLAIYEE